MKHINTIFRMLCLTALLCMTSANASAYVVYDGQGDIILNPETMGDNRIMVVEGEVPVNSIEVSNDYVLIILPGAKVTSEHVFYGGEIYVFGALRINTSIYGEGKIYLLVGGELDLKNSAPPPAYITIKRCKCNEKGRRQGSYGHRRRMDGLLGRGDYMW